MFGINGGGFVGRLGADVEIDQANNRAKCRVAISMDKEYSEWVTVWVAGPKSGVLDWLAKGKKGDKLAVMASRLSTKPNPKVDVAIWLNVNANSSDVELVPQQAKDD